MENLLIVQESFSETVGRYVSREVGLGKNPRRTMGRLMGNWVLNALKRTRKADKAAILEHWMKPSTRGRLPSTRAKRSKLAHEMAETQAIAYVRFINYGGKAKSLSFQDLRILARKFVKARVFSAGIHKAGYIPALRVLRQAAGERPPRYKNEPGTEPKWTENPHRLSVEVMNFANIIAELAPNAFEDGAAELQGFLQGYLAKDLVEGLNNAGVNAK